MRLDQIRTRFGHDFTRVLADDRLPMVQIGTGTNQLGTHLELLPNLGCRQKIHRQVDAGHQKLGSRHKIAHPDHIIQHQGGNAPVQDSTWIAHVGTHGEAHSDLFLAYLQKRSCQPVASSRRGSVQGLAYLSTKIIKRGIGAVFH